MYFKDISYSSRRCWECFFKCRVSWVKHYELTVNCGIYGTWSIDDNFSINRLAVKSEFCYEDFIV